MDNFNIIDDNFKIISEINIPLGEDEPSKRLLKLCSTSNKGSFTARYHFTENSDASCTFDNEIELTSKDIENMLDNYPIEKVKAPDTNIRNLEIPSVKVVVDLVFASCLVFSKGEFSFLDFNVFLHYYFGYYRNNFKIDNANDRLTLVYKGRQHTVSLSKFIDRLSTFFVGFIRDYHATCLLKECNWYERVMMSTKLDISYGVDVLVKLNDGTLVGIDNSYDRHSLFTKFKDNPGATELNDYAYGCIKEIEYMGKIEKIPVILFNIYYSGHITCGGVYLPDSKYAQNVDDSINRYLDTLRGEK